MESNFYETKLKFASSTFNGNSLNDAQKEAFSSAQDGLKYVSSKDIDVNSNQISLSAGLTIPADELSKYKIAPSSSPLLCIEGGSAGRKIGFTNTEVCFVNKLACFSPKKCVSGRFLFYSLLSKPFRYQFDQAMTGMIGGVSISSINNFKIFLPNYGLQSAVTAYLDREVGRIDSLITEKQRFVTLLKEKRQALISHVVTKGLDVNVKMKDSGVEWIGDVPEHWTVVKLKYATKQIIDGSHHTPTYVDSGIPFLRVTDITGDKENIDWSAVKFIPEDEHLGLIKRSKPEYGDILLSKNGTIGVTKLIDWNEEFSIFVSLCLIKVNERLLATYFEHFFKSKIVEEQISLGSKTTSVTNLHLDKIRELKIILPEITEQQEISDYLSHKAKYINTLISEVKASIDLLKEKRSALISAAVTGKIDVRGFNNKEAS